MADFSFVKEQLKTDNLARMTLAAVQFPGQEEPAVLIGRIAGEGNKPFFAETARRTIKRQRMRQGGHVSPEMAIKFAKQDRDDDREMYSEHVMTGWENVSDANGDPVAFSNADCLALFQSLPNDVFDQVRTFFSSSINFRDTVSEDESKAKGKN